MTEERVRPVINTGPGLTKQSHKDECDVNLILRNFVKTGVIAFTNRNQPMYGDIPSTDFHEAMNTVAQATQMFDQMPAVLRKRFANDPGVFLEFIQNPDNVEEARRLRLLPPERPTAPEEAESPPQAEP